MPKILFNSAILVIAKLHEKFKNRPEKFIVVVETALAASRHDHQRKSPETRQFSDYGQIVSHPLDPKLMNLERISSVLTGSFAAASFSATRNKAIFFIRFSRALFIRLGTFLFVSVVVILRLIV